MKTTNTSLNAAAPVYSEEFTSIMLSLANNGNVIVDDHGNGNETRTLTHVGMYKGKCVPLLDGKNFCINPLTLDSDGTVHLSTWSIGGVVLARDEEMLDAVKVHNSQKDWMNQENLVDQIEVVIEL